MYILVYGMVYVAASLTITTRCAPGWSETARTQWQTALQPHTALTSNHHKPDDGLDEMLRILQGRLLKSVRKNIVSVVKTQMVLWPDLDFSEIKESLILVKYAPFRSIPCCLR